jgi:serine/threonine protein kinase
LTSKQAEALAATLVADMIRRWRTGDRPLPEEYLARHPELAERPEAAADLIYEELCLRQECGLEVPAEQVLARFPQWRPQLEVLVDCLRLLGPRQAAPRFPEAGEALGDFLLLAELGRGAQARVFLAAQLSLGGRLVVLKVAPPQAEEHLSLARLQHTHIVPLYSAQDHPAHGLRALCMPYFGGATLCQLLEAVRPRLPAQRTGRDLLDAMEGEQARVSAACGMRPVGSPGAPRGAAALAAAPYAEAVSRLGACLAEALAYAHGHGLVHLDLKPSNVLVTAAGQPMVLDFHLARQPIHPDGDGPQWLGGTPGYMSPEQQAALQAAAQGRRVLRPVDGRSDVYSLGVVLYEALAGSLPGAGAAPRTLRRRNARVSAGLADVVCKCLAPDPAGRYPDMAALAADLRRHLADLPLAGVRNRSLVERWRKWRRRQPHRLALVGVLLAALAAAVAAATGAASQFAGQVEHARTALADGQSQMDNGEWDAAVATLRRGLSAARTVPGQHRLAGELGRRLCLAEQGRDEAGRRAAAGRLHELADRVRFLYGADSVSRQGLIALAARCRALWEERGRVVGRLVAGAAAPPAPAVREDLLDLAIFWAELRVRLAPPAERAAARRQALAVLDEAEELCGPGPVLDAERRLHGGPRRPSDVGLRAPQSAWEHATLGRALLRSGDLAGAALELGQAVRMRPQGLWPNFYHGVCAYRLGRYEDAVAAFSVCIGAAPAPAACLYNRALALDALGRTGRARADYDQAMRLDPTLATAAPRRAGTRSSRP